jgi:hypothetical protein
MKGLSSPNDDDNDNVEKVYACRPARREGRNWDKATIRWAYSIAVVKAASLEASDIKDFCLFRLDILWWSDKPICVKRSYS